MSQSDLTCVSESFSRLRITWKSTRGTTGLSSSASSRQFTCDPRLRPYKGLSPSLLPLLEIRKSRYYRENTRWGEKLMLIPWGIFSI